MDASSEMFDQMMSLADDLGGQLGLTTDGRVVIAGVKGDLERVAAGVSNDQFGFGFIRAEGDFLTFEF